MKKNNGFAIWTVAASVLIFFGAISFSACQNELLDSPHFQTRGSYATGRVAAPTKLTATQGGYKSITLTWTAAKSAVIYNIYHSDTATGTFEFLGQTSDATCTYTVGGLEPDVKKYYKVQSVDSNSETSEGYSQICYGTTLAAPIITSVNQNANGDQITVRWYKGVNCTEETYLNSGLNYTVILYNADGTQVLQETTISALDVKNSADTKYTFKNLTPNTNYFIQVKAYTKSAQDAKSTENSDILNQSTAHSLIPAAPENFQAAKGTSKDGIALSWVLPKFAEIKASTTYETRPVYFKVFRKLESAPETAYEPIVTYLGTTDTDKIEKNAVHFVKTTDESGKATADIRPGASLAGSTAEDGTEIPSKIDVKIEYPEEAAETDPNYPNYIPGTKITLTDKTASRGEKYSYRIQSFIDDNGKKNVTSDESWSDGTGWLINSPTVSVSSEPKINADDDSKIDSFTVTLNFKFDDFGQPYNYVITETCQKMRKATEEEIKAGQEDQPEGDPEIKNQNSTSYKDFFPRTFTYTPTDEENIYLLYIYDVAVCPKDSGNDDSGSYIKVSATGSVIVINDKSMIPDVSSFKIEDGYKDKFKLTWIYDKNCKYTLSWKNTDKDGKETEGTYDFQESDFVDSENNPIENKSEFTYSHPAESGDIRTEYTLNADNGLKNHKTIEDTLKTLGTPQPYFEPTFNSIKVIWNEVQKAEGYEASYKFAGKDLTTGEDIASEGTISSADIQEEKDENGKLLYYYYEITKPYGTRNADGEETDYSTDASVSGKNIDFVLKAKSAVDESSKQIQVATLGPANLNLKITGERKAISMTWNNVPGAKGYLIFRKKYIKDYFSTEENKGDLYYYAVGTDSEDSSLTLLGSDAAVSASCNQITENTLKFTDKYQPVSEADYNDQYKTDQAQLAWGIPYGYTVIPVVSSSDFEFDDEYTIQGTDSSIRYTSESLAKVETKGATYGYGLAIEASKAATSDAVKLTWKRPYNSTWKPTVLFRRYNEKNGSGWNQVENFMGETATETASCAPSEPSKAYDYMVYYNLDGNPEIDSYYEHFLSTRIDEDKEKANKGYIFSFETPKAQYAGSNDKNNPNYYSERLTWRSFGTNGFNIYDTEERKKKPDTIEIRMLNTNKSVGWQTVATIDTNDLKKATADSANCLKYDIDIDTSDNYSITIAPDGIKNRKATNTNGLMKVLRDAKHYYKIAGSRTTGDTTVYAETGNNGSVYAYRQITDEELVKATMLVIADVMQDTKMDDGKYTFGTNGAKQSEIYGYSNDINSGYFTWSQYLKEFYWYITNYTRGWSKLPYQDFSKITHTNPLKNFITISDINSKNKTRGKKVSSNYPSFLCYDNHKNFEQGTLIPIEITPSGEPFNSLSSYSGKINFKSSDSNFSVTVEHNGSQTFKKDVSGDEVKKWFPAKIGNNAYIGDTAEYWWE